MTTPSSCPACGASSSGNFCSACGTPLGPRHCTQCGGALTPGARFCNACGTGVASNAPTRSGPAPRKRTNTSGTHAPDSAAAGESPIGWWAAGGLMVVLIVVVLWPVLRPDQVAPTGGGGSAGATQVPFTGSAGGGAAAVDLSSMTPREAADRLFGRVMSAAETGDSAQAMQFLPMAIQAYERALPLDLDGLFHLSTLQRTGLDLDAALATAQQGLADDPDHLLLLHAAGEAATELGDAPLADGYFARILEVFADEMGEGNPDYEAHSGMMDSIRRNALARTGG